MENNILNILNKFKKTKHINKRVKNIEKLSNNRVVDLETYNKIKNLQSLGCTIMEFLLNKYYI